MWTRIGRKLRKRFESKSTNVMVFGLQSYWHPSRQWTIQKIFESKIIYLKNYFAIQILPTFPYFCGKKINVEVSLFCNFPENEKWNFAIHGLLWDVWNLNCSWKQLLGFQVFWGRDSCLLATGFISFHRTWRFFFSLFEYFMNHVNFVPQ